MSYLVTSCPSHGETVAPDARSALHYQECASDCVDACMGGDVGAIEHLRFERAHGFDCWFCCPDIAIAPGIVEVD